MRCSPIYKNNGMIHPDGDRKGVIKTIAETGKIVTHLEETFPANKITDPEIFQSLLFYYGMLTIKGTRGDKLILGIPNNNVRKQYYACLLPLARLDPLPYEAQLHLGAEVDSEEGEGYDEEGA